MRQGGISMSIVMTAASLMKRAYSGNTLFRDANYRKNRNGHEVVSADRKAMTRALDQLSSLDFDSTEVDDTKSIYNTVTAYLDVYNHAVSSTTNSDSSQIARTGKQMRALMKEYDQELSDIGISIKSDGTVKVNTTELKKATTRQVSKVFGNDEYISGMSRLMKKLRNQVNRSAVSSQYSESTKTQKQDDVTKIVPAGSETVGSNLNLYA